MEGNKNSNPLQTEKENQQAGYSAQSQVKSPKDEKGAKDAKDTTNDAKKQPLRASRRIFSKRWVYPALYLGAAALIIGLMYIKSQSGTSPVSSGSVEPGQTTPTTATVESLQWPVDQPSSVDISMGYFPAKGTVAEQSAALVYYDNAYWPHMGIDLKTQNGQGFNVTAATSGKVISVTDDPLRGKTVEIAGGGYVEQYESLSSINVQAGQTVTQGQAIGVSGTCLFEKSQGNHLYFALLKDGQSVDPTTLLPAR